MNDMQQYGLSLIQDIQRWTDFGDINIPMLCVLKECIDMITHTSFDKEALITLRKKLLLAGWNVTPTLPEEQNRFVEKQIWENLIELDSKVLDLIFEQDNAEEILTELTGERELTGEEVDFLIEASEESNK